MFSPRTFSLQEDTYINHKSLATALLQRHRESGRGQEQHDIF